MLSFQNPLDLQIQQSPSTPLAFEDVVVLNADDYDLVEGQFCCVMTRSGKKMILPFCNNKGVLQGSVGLSNRQRQFLEVDKGESVQVHLGYDSITIIPVIAKVTLHVSAYFLGGKSTDYREQISLIMGHFLNKFDLHPLNTGHTIPLKVNGMLLDFKVVKLSGADIDWPFGIMDRGCEIHVDAERFSVSEC